MTEPDLWMKGLGRVLSWVGQDLPTEARGKGSSEGEADIDVLAQRLLTQGRLSADDEATLELLRATIQSARVERSLADQSAGALRLDLKSLQEELSASRSEVLRLGRALDEAGNKKREQDNLLEQRDLELEDAASERSKLEEQVEEHAARVEALEMRLSELKKAVVSSEESVGELSASQADNDSLRSELAKARAQLHEGKLAWESAETALNQEIEEARGARAAAENSLHEAEQRAKTAAERANRSEERALRAEERAERAEEESRHLDQVVSHSRRRVDEGESSRQELEDALADATRAKEAAEAQLAQTQRHFEEHHALRLAEDSSATRMLQELGGFDDEATAMAALSTAPPELQNLCVDLFNRLQAEQVLSSEFKSQLQLAGTEADAQDETHKARIAELEAARAKLEKRLHEAAEQVADADERAAQVDVTVEELRTRAKRAEEELITTLARAEDAEERAGQADAVRIAAEEWEEIARRAEEKAQVTEEKFRRSEERLSSVEEELRRASERAAVAEETALRSAMEAERAAGAGEKALEALARYEERCRKADERAEEANRAQHAAIAKKAEAEVVAAQAKQRAEATERQIRELQAAAQEQVLRVEQLEEIISTKQGELAQANKNIKLAERGQAAAQKRSLRLETELSQSREQLSDAEQRATKADEAGRRAVQAAQEALQAKMERELLKKEAVLETIRGELASKERDIAEQLAEARAKVELATRAQKTELERIQAAAEQQVAKKVTELERIRSENASIRAEMDKLLAQAKAVAAREVADAENLNKTSSRLAASERKRQELLEALESARSDTAAALVRAQQSDEQIAQTQAAKEQLAQAHKAARIERQEAEGRIGELLERCEATEGRVASLEEALRERESQLSLVRLDLERAQDALDEAQARRGRAGGPLELDARGEDDMSFEADSESPEPSFPISTASPATKASGPERAQPSEQAALEELPQIEDLLEDIEREDAKRFDNSVGKIYSAKREEEPESDSFLFFRRKK